MVESGRDVTLEEVVVLARQLSALDKVRLIEQLAPEIERDIAGGRPTHGVSMLGLLKDLGPAPSVEELDNARREAWARFPREDI